MQFTLKCLSPGVCSDAYAVYWAKCLQNEAEAMRRTILSTVLSCVRSTHTLIEYENLDFLWCNRFMVRAVGMRVKVCKVF